jgi:hypothetical protein
MTVETSAAPKTKARWQPVPASKCVVCSKAVYEIEKLVADERVFHKTCFKCEHCKKTLSLGNFASLNEKTYCKVRQDSSRLGSAPSPDQRQDTFISKLTIDRHVPLPPRAPQPHFKQLFAEKGNYGAAFGMADPKKAWSASSPATKSAVTAEGAAPGGVKSLAAKFGSVVASSKCPCCAKTAYPMESVEVNGETYHKGCFKCVTCGVSLNLGTFLASGGKLYCRRDVPKAEAKVGMSVQLAAAMEAQRLASSAASSGDAVARYGASAPAAAIATSPAASPAPEKKAPAPVPEPEPEPEPEAPAAPAEETPATAVSEGDEEKYAETSEIDAKVVDAAEKVAAAEQEEEEEEEGTAAQEAEAEDPAKEPEEPAGADDAGNEPEENDMANAAGGGGGGGRGGKKKRRGNRGKGKK